jgi:hypothetical protein
MRINPISHSGVTVIDPPILTTLTAPPPAAAPAAEAESPRLRGHQGLDAGGFGGGFGDDGFYGDNGRVDDDGFFRHRADRGRSRADGDGNGGNFIGDFTGEGLFVAVAQAAHEVFGPLAGLGGFLNPPAGAEPGPAPAGGLEFGADGFAGDVGEAKFEAAFVGVRT